MYLLKVRRTSGLFFKTILVVFTLSYFSVILCSYKSNFNNSLSYKYRGLEVIGMQHTPTARLFLYAINGPHSAGIEVVPSNFHELSIKVFLSKAAIVTPYAVSAFYVCTTINAP